MEKKRKNDVSTGHRLSRTPEVKVTENDSSRNTPRSRNTLNRYQSDKPGSNLTPARPSPRRRSATSTPESVTQRELKKLEDYWTRNDPVKEDSPRLRSNRNVNFNVKAYLIESPRAKRSPKSETISSKRDKAEQLSLPESPIPQKQRTPNKVNIRDENGLSKSDSRIPSTNKQAATSPTSLSKKLSNLSHTSKKKTTKYCETKIHSCNNRVSYPDEPQQKLVELELDTSSDSDDDDYIPPRKKLRSEVTEDELWDGIPLTVSFKRLAPIPKTSNDQAGEFSQIESKKPVEAVEAVEEQRPTTETPPKGTTNDNDNKSKENAENSLQLQSITRKRSARLIDKKSGTPFKVDRKRNETELKNTSISESPKMGTETYVKDLPESISEVCTDAGSCSLNGPQNKVEGSIAGDNLLKLTLSHIFSVDSTNGVHRTEKSNDPENNAKEHGTPENVTSATSNAITSISKTINDIFGDISGPSEQGIREEIETTQNADKIAGNDTRVTRRSRRLSDLEKRKSCPDSPVFKPENDEHVDTNSKSIVEEESTLLENELKVLEHEDDATSWFTEHVVSKHKLFTKYTDKITAKTVPPLRIKLKQPLNGGSTLNTSAGPRKTCNTKAERNNMKKVSKVIEGTKKEQSRHSSSKVAEIDAKNNSPKEPDRAENEPSTSKPKKKITKQRRCRSRPHSPPPSDSIALRLNNERRLSAAGSLLSNPVLNKHACVLWSSENRRHVQLSNPKATLSELDAKLSLKWDRLSDKEKLKYFQRARDAIKDDNRHSNRRQNVAEEDNSKKDATDTFSSESSMDNFLKLPALTQMLEIKKWLNFYNEVSPETCSEVINSFKESLVEENKNKTKDTELKEKSKTKSKKNKQKKKEERPEPTDSNSTYRKIMFEKILDKKDYIIGILVEKKRSRNRSVLDAYCGILKRLVTGEAVDFFGDVRSDKLTETLSDVKALERASRLAVTGVTSEGEDYDDILARLNTRTSPVTNGISFALDHMDVNDGHIEHICQQVQSLPSLSPKTLEDHLPEIGIPDSPPKEDIPPPLRIGRGKGTTSPVTVLTEWVADDLLACQPQIGFRKAISLLSNKVVPSPTIILPPKATNGSTSSANKNQNCNIVFTKLQRARPSVFTAKINMLK